MRVEEKQGALRVKASGKFAVERLILHERPIARAACGLDKRSEEKRRGDATCATPARVPRAPHADADADRRRERQRQPLAATLARRSLHQRVKRTEMWGDGGSQRSTQQHYCTTK